MMRRRRWEDDDEKEEMRGWWWEGKRVLRESNGCAECKPWGRMNHGLQRYEEDSSSEERRNEGRRLFSLEMFGWRLIFRFIQMFWSIIFISVAAFRSLKASIELLPIITIQSWQNILRKRRSLSGLQSSPSSFIHPFHPLFYPAFHSSPSPAYVRTHDFTQARAGVSP